MKKPGDTSVKKYLAKHTSIDLSSMRKPMKGAMAARPTKEIKSRNHNVVKVRRQFVSMQDLDKISRVRRAQLNRSSGKKSQGSVERLGYQHPDYDVRLDPCRGLFNELYWEENEHPVPSGAIKSLYSQKKNLARAYRTIKPPKEPDLFGDYRSPDRIDERLLQARYDLSSG